MKTGDPRVEYHRLHGQDVYIPNADAWRDILADGLLDGDAVSLVEWARGWLNDYSQFAVAALGVYRLAPWPREWAILPLLRLGGRFLRVHFEDVICEHCNRRCGPSATPDYVAYAGTGLTIAESVAEFAPFPIQQCPFCRGVLRRRQTVWLAAAGGSA